MTLSPSAEDASEAMSFDLSTNSRFGDESVVEKYIALFACLLSPCNLHTDILPTSFFRVFKESPFLELRFKL